ncbi:MAG TPA: RpiB/LacA/LacB family sugar-phosphate isomerase [Candidatus Paceibacterota bacterium]
MKIIIGADHAGFALKEALKSWLVTGGHEVVDVGAFTMTPDDDYPDYVLPMAEAILSDSTDPRAVFCARSGEGEAIAANRHRGIRAIVYNSHNLEVIKRTRTDNNANIMCIGSDFVTATQIEEALTLWLSIPFDTTSRHARRLAKIDG